MLATAKYLINDTSFGPYLQKKKGQVYLNTWHGTPLKALGRKIQNESYEISNVQKNFVSADFILFPNDHTCNAIIEDYMLANISSGSYIMGGYPRNEIFFDKERRLAVKKKLNLTGKRVYAFMPTFRGQVNVGGTSKNSHYLNYYLYEIDKRLAEDEEFYVNLHPLAKKDVDFATFEHIKQFPDQYETYDFLNATDVLITDYSSVFFDYAVADQKAVLFVYDREEYLKDRGMYMSMDDLPYPQVTDIDSLFAELRSDKNYDDSEFLAKYCSYENAAASQKIADYVILGKDTGLEVHPIPNNGKENVLIYAGNLSGNGITNSLRNLLCSLDLEKRNYYFAFYSARVKDNKDNIQTFPSNVNFFAMTGEQNLTVSEFFFQKAFRKKLIPAQLYMKYQGKRVKQDFERVTGSVKFDHVIQFNGYEADVILSFSTFEGSKTIFVHSDMLQEIKTKGNQRLDVLRYAYKHYDNVAIVTEDMMESTLEISGRKDNIHVAKNLVNYRNILNRAEEPIVFDPVTKMSMPEEYVREILQSDNELFINVGRFSPEKGHERLVSAFAKYRQLNPEAYLVIMGGYSVKNGYEKLNQYVKNAGLQEYVILLENVSNPYPVIKACDYFVMSSFYEGFGLVLVEADILGLPAVSTDIPGPRGFVNKYNGTLVENSEAGILHGMEMLHNGEIKPMDVDYEAYNQEAIREFESLLHVNVKSNDNNLNQC